MKKFMRKLFNPDNVHYDCEGVYYTDWRAGAYFLLFAIVMFSMLITIIFT